MEKKIYVSPLTDLIKIETNTSLLDWSAPKDDGGGGNIPEAKIVVVIEEDEEEEFDMEMFRLFDVWK